MAIATDVLVIGTGVAGLTAALAAAPRRVLLISKRDLKSGSSPLAQGGVAAALGADDSPLEHAADTLRVGRGLGLEPIVEELTNGGPGAVRRVAGLGVDFDRELGREAGHGRSRILHAGGDRTGAAIVAALVEAVRRAPHVRLMEHVFAVDLLTSGGRALGALVLDEGDAPSRIFARDVVLATGGLGQIYRRTTNPKEVTGDGIAMAARAGARLVDLEFVQFHPTALALEEEGAALPLLTEALRGAGARVVDERGHRFLADVHPDAELAPRDVVAREIFRRTSFLDLRPLGSSLESRFPTVVAHCRGAGWDPSRDVVPVTAAAHYFMGGVAVDDVGRTSIAALWACGENASTGAHGANRLASNSLLEALVFGDRMGGELSRSTGSHLARVENIPHPEGTELDGDVEAKRSRVRDIMWNHVGIERDGAGLARALAELEELSATLEGTPVRSRSFGELRNTALAAKLVTAAALFRRESRGAHFRRDFPATHESWRRRISFHLDRNGRVEVEPAETLLGAVQAGGAR